MAGNVVVTVELDGSSIGKADGSFTPDVVAEMVVKSREEQLEEVLRRHQKEILEFLSTKFEEIRKETHLTVKKFNCKFAPVMEYGINNNVHILTGLDWELF